MTLDIGHSSSSSSSDATVAAIYFSHTQSGRALRYVADLEAPADLGTIAGFFSLNPISLRLNGHFISSSTTTASASASSHGSFISSLSWKQILCFFDSRGFTSGRHALSPVSVGGRPLQSDRSESRGEDCDKDAFCSETEKYEVEEDNQRIKRPKHESNLSSGVPMMSKSVTPEYLKRKHELCEEGSVYRILSKRMKHERDTQKNDDHHKPEGMSGFKRKLSGEEVSVYGQLWKRLEEIRV